MRPGCGFWLCAALAAGACGDDDGGDEPDAAPISDAAAIADGAVPADTSPGADGAAAAPWRPVPGTSWQWQLSGTIDTSIDVAMYDVDLVDAPTAVLTELRGAGRVVICYFSAGSWEEWRDDANEFPPSAIGDALDGWPGERWLDVRDSDVRRIMRARLDLAAARGCDGVEPDNVDGYANSTGFPLTASDQLAFNRFLAAEAHARGLSVGLKNDLDQIADLIGDFDWALNEECFAYGECDTLAPFIAAGKAVFQVEYGSAALADTVCPQANARDFDTLIKNLELDAWRVGCRD